MKPKKAIQLEPPKVMYVRGSFRVERRCHNHRVGFYWVQARDIHDVWFDLEPMDFLSSARTRVHNLHTACCTMQRI